MGRALSAAQRRRGPRADVAVPGVAAGAAAGAGVVCRVGGAGATARSGGRCVSSRSPFPVLLVLCAVAGGQVYYPVGLLVVLFAAGCVPVADVLARAARWWRSVLVAAVALNAVVSAVVALPLLPVTVLGAHPVPGSTSWPATRSAGPPTCARSPRCTARCLRPTGPARWWWPATTARPAPWPGTGRRCGCRRSTAGTTRCTTRRAAGHGDRRRRGRRPAAVGRAASSPRARSMARLDNRVGVGQRGAGRADRACAATRVVQWAQPSGRGRFRHRD